MVVPSGEILNVVHPRLRSRCPANQLWRGPDQGVPGQIQGTLHNLGSEPRQTTAGFDDCAYQAGRHNRMAGQLLGVVGVDWSNPSAVVAICKPAFLQPAGAYQVGSVVENAGNLIKLGEPRADLVADPELP